jgi:hypothetical protein
LRPGSFQHAIAKYRVFQQRVLRHRVLEHPVLEHGILQREILVAAVDTTRGRGGDVGTKNKVLE